MDYAKEYDRMVEQSNKQLATITEQAARISELEYIKDMVNNSGVSDIGYESFKTVCSENKIMAALIKSMEVLIENQNDWLVEWRKAEERIKALEDALRQASGCIEHLVNGGSPYAAIVNIATKNVNELIGE